MSDDRAGNNVPPQAAQIAGSLIVAIIIVIVTIALVTSRVQSLPYLPEEQAEDIQKEREDAQKDRQKAREDRLEELEDKNDNSGSG
jgi:hypothetical protein